MVSLLLKEALNQKAIVNGVIYHKDAIDFCSFREGCVIHAKGTQEFRKIVTDDLALISDIDLVWRVTSL